MTTKTTSPTAVPAMPSSTWKAAIGSASARTKRVATPETARNWPENAPMMTFLESAVRRPAPIARATSAARRTASGRCRVRRR